MKEQKEYLNPFHGLELNPGFKPRTRDNENGILFLLVLFLLKRRLKMCSEKKADIAFFNKVCINLRTYESKDKQIPGIFDRGAKESLNKAPEDLRLISRDNLMAIAGGSKVFGLNHAKELVSYGMRNLGRFDNAYPNSPRWYYKQNGATNSPFQWQPGDWSFWLLCSDSIIHRLMGTLMFPILLITCLISCLSKKDITSGKQLVFVRCESLSKTILGKVLKLCCYSLLKCQYGEKWEVELFKIYYGIPYPNHPIMKLVNLI